MRSWMGSIIVLSLWPGLQAFSQEKNADAPAVDRDLLRDVRRSLQVREFADVIDKLEKAGGSLNGVYLTILKDDTVSPGEVDRIFSLVANQKLTDRSPFLPFATKGVGDADAGVRGAAARLFEQIGSASDASLLVPLLSDEDVTVQYRGAEALERIGTAREIEAFDRRLAAKHPQNQPDLMKDLKQHRDRLQKRLEAAKKQE